MRRIEIFNFPVSIGSYQNFVASIIDKANSPARRGYVCVANVHMLIEARNDAGFMTTVQGADIITPDGKPLTWALRLLYGVRQDRVAGMDLLPDLLQQSVVNKLPVFFVGGTTAVLEKTKQHLAEYYPGLQLGGMISPPFRPLTEDENQSMINDINASGAKLVFVILGCPKQENWMASMRQHLDATLVGVGGALPVMVKMQKRAPRWMQKIGMEWLYRLVQEPRRLFKRYAYTNTIFLCLLFSEFIRIRVFRKKVTPEPGITKLN